MAANYLPTTSAAANNRDEFLFGRGMEQANQMEFIQGLFGEKILSENDPGYAAQRSRMGAFIRENQGEIDAKRAEMMAGVNQQRAQRLLNQTGGVRNGVARNPFNMNMLRGPQMGGAPTAAPKAPSQPTAPAFGGGPNLQGGPYAMR
jgi:hypothetical protein